MSKGNTSASGGSRQAKYAATDKGQAASRAAYARYADTEKGQTARQRAARRQAERRRQGRLLEAERRRVRRIMEMGLLDDMSASAKEEWLRRCGDENPTMLQALRDEGIC